MKMKKKKKWRFKILCSLKNYFFFYLNNENNLNTFELNETQYNKISIIQYQVHDMINIEVYFYKSAIT